MAPRIDRKLAAEQAHALSSVIQDPGEQALLSDQAHTSGNFRLTIQARHFKRDCLRVPVQVQSGTETLIGLTKDFSPGGLRLTLGASLEPGIPLTLQCSFGGVCHLNLSGQVVYCLPNDDTQTGFGIGVKFTAIREWEQFILLSAAKELREQSSTREHSLLTIVVSQDHLAQEAAALTKHSHDVAPHLPMAKFLADCTQEAKTPTPNPAWVVELVHQIEPHWKAVLESRLVQEASTGSLSLTRMRAWIIQLYPFIETFPKWIALILTKVHDPISRNFMIDNIRVEKKHADQWVYMANGFGIDSDEIRSAQPLPETEALTHWLWSINSQGSVAESVAATNFAIEGVTQGIAKLTVKGFPSYDKQDGVCLDKKAYWWMESHARYDDIHPVQALEVMKLYTTTQPLEQKVIFAARRSLEYMLMALDACYTRFK